MAILEKCFLPAIVAAMLCLGAVTGQFEEVEEEVPSTHVPHILTDPSVVEATIGEEIRFACDVDDLGDFVIVWKRRVMEKNQQKDEILFALDIKIVRSSRFNLEKSTLVISKVQPSDSGVYVCQLSTTPVSTEVSHSLDVRYPPTVKAVPEEGVVTVKEGETVTLTCMATGHPKPTIMWKHAGRVYESSDDKNYLITSAEKDDSGEYECVADNSVGDPASATITVEVVSAPKITPDPKDGVLVVKEGEKISMSCEASGDPMPVITWKRPGEKPLKVRDENRIVISQADRSHAGTYECVANNSLGIFTSSIFRVQVLYAPEVKADHKWIHAGEGTDVNISCVIRGEPMPSVQWKKKDGHVIHPNTHYHTKNAGHIHTLEIRRLMEEDFGGYECIASNSLSTAMEHLHIIGTPQIPVFTSKPHSSQGTKYTLSWTVDSHTPVDEYSLMYRKKSSNGEWESKTVPATDKHNGKTHIQMFQLMDLQPNTSYEALVTARNKFGWSKQSEALVFTTREVTMNSLPESELTLEPSENDSDDKYSDKVQSGSSIPLLSYLSMLPIILAFYRRSL